MKKNSSKGISLRNMTDVGKNVYDISMFSKDGWKMVHNNTCIKDAFNNARNEDVMDNGFLAFMILWLRDMMLSIDLLEYEIRGEWYIYYEERSCSFVKSKHDLHKALIDRFCDYLLGD